MLHTLPSKFKADYHFPDVAIKSVLDDIFGSQQDEVFAEGLVDCSSDDEFTQKLQFWRQGGRI